jgi:predicted Zn-dependent protease
VGTVHGVAPRASRPWPHFPAFLLAATLAALALALFAPHANAQDAPPPAPRPTLAPETAERIPELSKLLEANNYDGLLALIDEILTTVKPDSFDRALLTQIRGQILLNAKRYAEAIPSLEDSRRLASNKNWFDRATDLQILHTLSQLYYQEASEAKTNPDRRKNLRLSIERINEWLTLTPAPSAEGYLYAATLLYTDATLDADKPDPALLRETLKTARTSLAVRAQDHEQTRVLIVATLQQLSLYEETAENIELLLSQKPNNPLYWQQLFAIYANLASEAKLPSQIRHWQIRSLVTLQRARKHGALNAPQDHFNSVAILFALHQFEHAALALEKGLAGGTIASTRQHWELLSSAWQQQRNSARAIDTLQKAVAKHPADSGLHFSFAQLLLSEGKPADAYTQAQEAAKSPKVERPGDLYFLLAYLAYELHRFDEAEKHLDNAAKHPGPNAPGIAQLRKALQASRTKHTN